MGDLPVSLQRARPTANTRQPFPRAAWEAAAPTLPRHSASELAQMRRGPSRVAQQFDVDAVRGAEAYAPPDPNGGEELAMSVLEPTGLPSVRRGARAMASGDPVGGAMELGMGALGALTMGELALPRRAPVNPVPRFGANDRGAFERGRAALTHETDFAEPASSPDSVNIDMYPQRLWNRRNEMGVSRSSYGPGEDFAGIYASDNDGELDELLAKLEADAARQPVLDRARTRWDLDPNDPVLRGSPDIAADPLANFRRPGFAPRERGPMQMPNEDRRWPMFGPPLRRTPASPDGSMRAPETPPARSTSAGAPTTGRIGSNSAAQIESSQSADGSALYDFDGPKGSRYRVTVDPTSGDGASVTFESLDQANAPFDLQGRFSPTEVSEIYRNVQEAIALDARSYARGSYSIAGADAERGRIHQAMIRRAVRRGEMPEGFAPNYRDQHLGETAINRANSGALEAQQVSDGRLRIEFDGGRWRVVAGDRTLRTLPRGARAVDARAEMGRVRATDPPPNLPKRRSPPKPPQSGGFLLDKP